MRRKSVAIIYLIFLFLVIVVLPFIFYVEHPIFVFLEQPITILIPTIFITFLYLRESGDSVKEFFRFNKITLKEFFLITLMVFLLPAIVGFIVNITIRYVEIPDFGDFYIKPEDGEGLLWELKAFFYSLFYGAIFPGFCEELLFRGSILSLSEQVSKKRALIIFINALLFGVFHMNLIQLFYTFALGLIFTKVVISTNSIFAGMYMHALYNFIIDLPSSFNVYKYPIIDKISYFIDGLGNNIYVVYLCAAGIYLIIFYIDHERKQKLAASEEEYLEDI